MSVDSDNGTEVCYRWLSAFICSVFYALWEVFFIYHVPLILTERFHHQVDKLCIILKKIYKKNNWEVMGLKRFKQSKCNGYPIFWRTTWIKGQMFSKSHGFSDHLPLYFRQCLMWSCSTGGNETGQGQCWKQQPAWIEWRNCGNICGQCGRKYR